MGVNSKIESVVVPFISSLFSSSSFSLISVDQNRLGDICSLMDLFYFHFTLKQVCEVAPQLWISFDYVTEVITAHSCLGARL